MQKLKVKIPRGARTVRHLLTYHDGIIIGSSIDDENAKDVDIIIPFSQWGAAVALLRTQLGKTVELNSFGGFKFKQDGLEIDVWPDSLEAIVFRPQFTGAYHWNSDTLIKPINGD